MSRLRDHEEAERRALLSEAVTVLREYDADRQARDTREHRGVNAPETIQRRHRLLMAIEMVEVAAARPEPRIDPVKLAHEDAAEGVAMVSIVGEADEHGYVGVARVELLSLHARLRAAEHALSAARATIRLLEGL